ncbi:fused MFS/spermidine synthase [Nocardioides perillae]|uniref:SAM-dependent methyltransferase n=1 Tax=Nocardioides perillae TaxID=1119534 RepID=A0A7Y9RSV6_9ACTN|nr:SAM-dependent methyltransferase [Nocardioides perillae]
MSEAADPRPTGEVRIEPAGRPGSWLVTLDGAPQSEVDLDDPTRLAFDYVRRMGDVLDARAPLGAALRVLHVGGGGLTLPRYVAATRPRSRQVVLEPHRALVARVRAELPLPSRSGISVREVDGRAGTAAVRDGWADVLVVDAFDDARVPGSLVTQEWYAETARVLAPGGWLLANLVDRAPWEHTRRTLAAARSALPHLLLAAEPSTLKGRRAGNLLLVAARWEVPVDALRAAATRSPLPYRVLDGREVSDAVGGGRPFTDADTRPGPRDA